MEYIQISIDGILYGSSYSLIALGFSLVFGVMRRINLAYGSSLLLGVAIALWVENQLNISIIFFIPIVLFFILVSRHLFVIFICCLPSCLFCVFFLYKNSFDEEAIHDTEKPRPEASLKPA